VTTEKKWLPVKLATSLVLYSLKASIFYNAHNAIKYLDNKFGVSSGPAKALGYLNKFSYFKAKEENMYYADNEGEQGGEKNAAEENKETESESTSNNNFIAEGKELKNDYLPSIKDNQNDNQINTKEIINTNQKKVDSGTQDDTIYITSEAINEDTDSEHFTVNNATTSIDNDPCNRDGLSRLE
jgi:hypothetical protein